MEKELHTGNKQPPPSKFTNISSDFNDFPQDMHVEEIFEQGGVPNTFSLFGSYKNLLQDKHTWHLFPKLDMHKFEVTNPVGWVSQME